MDPELRSFVKESLSRGKGREEIAAELGKAGWPADETRAALAAYAESAWPVPVPRRKPYLSAREAFVYLTTFLCLAISSVGAGWIAFEIIDRTFPDPSVGYRADSSTMHLWTAALIVAFPLFLALSSRTARALAADPSKRDSLVRKWLTYLTLFATAAAAIVDSITLIYGLLEGDLTVRSVCKVLTVLVIAGAIFVAYLFDLRKEEAPR
jgi:hypothetical protein